MKAVYLNNFLQQISECDDRPAFDDSFIVRINAIRVQLTSDMLQPSQRRALKQIYKERAQKLLEPRYSHYQYTTEPRSCNAPWIALAYWLENIQYSVHIMAKLPSITKDYADSFLLIVGPGPDYDAKNFIFSYVDYDAKKTDLVTKNTSQFVKKFKELLPQPSASPWQSQCLSVPAEELSHLLAVSGDPGQVLPNYLQILIPSVTNKKSVKSFDLLTNSPGKMDLHVHTELPSLLTLELYHNSYIYTTGKHELFYVTDQKITTSQDVLSSVTDQNITMPHSMDVLSVEQVPLTDGKGLFDKLLEEGVVNNEGDRFELSRTTIKQLITPDSNHIPFELRGLYLSGDNKELYRIKDLEESFFSKRMSLGIDHVSLKNGCYRALTLQEFLALRSKKGVFPCTDGLNQTNVITYVNFWEMLLDVSLPDWRFPPYILRKPETNLSQDNILYLEKTVTSKIKYSFYPLSHSFANSSSQTSQVKKNKILITGETDPMNIGDLENPFVVRNLFPVILDAMQKNGHRISAPRLPIGDILPGLVQLINQYFSSQSNKQSLFQELFNEWETTLFSKSPDAERKYRLEDQNCLFSQPVDLGDIGTRYLLDILLDCKEYALGISKSDQSLSWGDWADKRAYHVTLTLDQQLKALTKWLVLQNASLVADSPALTPIYEEVQLGLALSPAKLWTLLDCLNNDALCNSQLRTFRPDLDLIDEIKVQRDVLLDRLKSKAERPILSVFSKKQQEQLMDQLHDLFDKNWTMRIQCGALAPALMNGPWLNLALALAGAQYFKVSSYQGRSPYRLLMPTLTLDVQAATRSRLEYEPLDQYVTSSDHEKLISLSLSERASVCNGRPFCNNEDHHIRYFTTEEWRQVAYADPRYARYIPYVDSELCLLTEPLSKVEPGKIYVRMAKRVIEGQTEYGLECLLQALSGERTQDILWPKELDLQYELYEPFQINRLKPFLPDIVQALSLKKYIPPLTEGALLEMIDVIAIKKLIDNSVQFKGFTDRDLEDKDELDTVFQAYVGLTLYLETRTKEQQDILLNHRFMVQGDMKSLATVLKGLQKEKAQEGEEGIHVLRRADLPKDVTPYMHCYVCTADTFVGNGCLSTSGVLFFITSPDPSRAEKFRLNNPAAFKLALEAKMQGSFLKLTPKLTHDLIIPFFDESALSQHRTCAAVNARSMLSVVFAHAPSAVMCDRLEHPPTKQDKENLNMAAYRATPRKVVSDSHGAAVRRIGLVLVSIMTHNFDLRTPKGYEAVCCGYSNRVSQEAFDVFNQYNVLLRSSDYRNARYLVATQAYTSLQRRLDEQVLPAAQTFSPSQSPNVSFFGGLYSTASSNEGTSSSAISPALTSFMANQWRKKLDSGRLYEDVQWFGHKQLFAKLWSILKGDPETLTLWLQRTSPSRSNKPPIIDLMDTIVSTSESTVVVFVIDVRVNIALNSLINDTSRNSLASYNALIKSLKDSKPYPSAFSELVTQYKQPGAFSDLVTQYQQAEAVRRAAEENAASSSTSARLKV